MHKLVDCLQRYRTALRCSASTAIGDQQRAQADGTRACTSSCTWVGAGGQMEFVCAAPSRRAAAWSSWPCAQQTRRLNLGRHVQPRSVLCKAADPSNQIWVYTAARQVCVIQCMQRSVPACSNIVLWGHMDRGETHKLSLHLPQACRVCQSAAEYTSVVCEMLED